MALAGGFGFFFVEFEVAGLAGDDVKLKPGANFGFRGRSLRGRFRPVKEGIHITPIPSPLSHQI